MEGVQKNVWTYDRDPNPRSLLEFRQAQGLIIARKLKKDYAKNEMYKK